MALIFYAVAPAVVIIIVITVDRMFCAIGDRLVPEMGCGYCCARRRKILAATQRNTYNIAAPLLTIFSCGERRRRRRRRLTIQRKYWMLTIMRFVVIISLFRFCFVFAFCLSTAYSSFNYTFKHNEIRDEWRMNCGASSSLNNFRIDFVGRHCAVCSVHFVRILLLLRGCVARCSSGAMASCIISSSQIKRRKHEILWQTTKMVSKLQYRWSIRWCSIKSTHAALFGGSFTGSNVFLTSPSSSSSSLLLFVWMRCRISKCFA